MKKEKNDESIKIERLLSTEHIKQKIITKNGTIF